MRALKLRVATATLALCLALAALAHAEEAQVIQHGDLRVAFNGAISPHTLPRQGTAPVKVSVSTKIASTDGEAPERLTRIAIAINRNGHFEPKGLPACPMREIQPSTTADALAACRSSLIGSGRFEAKVLYGKAPFPSQGKLYAFNSRIHGAPAILAHVYGTEPVPTSFTLPFEVRQSKGTFGTTLIASLPEVTGDSSAITGLALTLGRSFSVHGKRRSYLSAGCPAPKGFSKATFPFARASFAFAGGKKVNQTLVRECGARG